LALWQDTLNWIRLRLDGAIMAELVSSTDVYSKEHNTWWIQRKKEDLEYPSNDDDVNRRIWFISEIEDVKYDKEQKQELYIKINALHDMDRSWNTFYKSFQPSTKQTSTSTTTKDSYWQVLGLNYSISVF
jgi:hypothetical protein